jgi:hypothetical protein
MELETHFGRVQIFSDALVFAKYCKKEWPSERINEVVVDIIHSHGPNYQRAVSLSALTASLHPDCCLGLASIVWYDAEVVRCAI